MKTLKIVFVAIATIMLISVLQPKVDAAIKVKSFDEMKTSINSFNNQGKKGSSGISASDMGNIIVPIVNILTAIGVIVLVGVTIIMGIKYMFASPEEAAKLKQQLIGLVVAGVVILGATAIWKIAYSVINSFGL